MFAFELGDFEQELSFGSFEVGYAVGQSGGTGHYFSRVAADGHHFGNGVDCADGRACKVDAAVACDKGQAAVFAVDGLCRAENDKGDVRCLREVGAAASVKVSQKSINENERLAYSRQGLQCE